MEAVDESLGSNDHQKVLCEQLWMLRMEGTMCDVILDVEGERLSAHRIILSACSPYLKTCCISKETNSTDGLLHIAITNCSYKVCLKMLEHLYTGRLALLSGSLLEEFDCLCQEWELKHPHGTQVQMDCKERTKVEENPAQQSRPISPSCDNSSLTTEETCQCLSNDSLSTDATESDMNIPSEQTPKHTTKFETKSTVSNRKTRSSQKITPSLQSSPENSPKRKKAATIKSHTLNEDVKIQKEKVKDVTDDNDSDVDNAAYDATTSNEDSSYSNDDLESSDKPKPKKLQNQKQHVKTSNNSKVPKKNIKKKTMLSVQKRPRGRPRKKLGSLVVSSTRPLRIKKASTFMCRQCDLEFERRLDLTQHRKEHHKEILNCAECQLQFPDRNQLLAHNVERHWREGLELPEIYSCKVAGCDFNTHKRMSWYNHRLHAHPSECSICDICGKALKNELTLRQHKAVVHPTSPRKVFACPSCDKVFKTESGMQKHKDVAHRSWTTERDKFVCPYCAHVCMLAESLTEHLYKKHDILPPSKKSYQCEHCDFKTTHVAEIKKHEIRHKPDYQKPFQCEKCDKRFVDRGSLVSHQLKHDVGANIFKCKYCEYSTKYIHNLRGHVQVRHEKKDHKPWECDECSYRCNSKGNLYKHLRNVHKRTVETKYTVARVGGEPTLPTADNDGRQLPQLPPLSNDNGPSVEQSKGLPVVVVAPEEMVPVERNWQHLVPPPPPEDSGIWTLQVDHNDSQCGPPPPSHGMPLAVPKSPSGPIMMQHQYEYVQSMRTVVSEPDHPATGHHTPLPPAHPAAQPQQQVHLPQNMDMNSLLYTYPGF